MEKKVSKVKVGLCALLGYSVLNIIRTILFDIAVIIINVVGIKIFRFGLVSIAFFYSFYFGYFVSAKIGEKLLKIDDALRRYEGAIGILLIINYTYFIIDYFRYREGSFYFISASLLVGFGMFVSNRKKKETVEEILEKEDTNYGTDNI